MDWLILLVFPIARSFAGWLQNAAEDGKFEWFEWRKLIVTVLQIVIPSLFLVLGMKVEEVYAAALVTVSIIVIDNFKDAIKKARNESITRHKKLK